MAITIPLMLWGWIPFVCYLFSTLKGVRAVIAAYILAWLFLPNFTYYFSGLPEFNKTTAATLGILIGTLIFERDRLNRFKFGVYDFVVLLWCLSPTLSSLSNGLGLYDGLSAFKDAIVVWYIPIFIGRIYFTDLDAIEDLFKGIFLGGLLYVPFCFLEMLVSPQFHNWVYGFHPHEFQQSIRGDSYRPVVFMQHGLMVGMWMMGASWAGVVLLKCKRLYRVFKDFHVDPFIWVIGLIIVFVLCRSMGALLFLFVLVGVLGSVVLFRNVTPIVLLLALPFSYVSLQIAGHWPNEWMIDKMEQFVGSQRVASFEFRVVNEQLLVEKAKEQSFLGWGGWGRSRIYNDKGEDVSVTDSLWIIIFGQNGVFGLVLLYCVFVIPVVGILRKLPENWWDNPQIIVLLATALLSAVYLCDSLVNDMRNPVFLLISGGLGSLASLPNSIFLHIKGNQGSSCESIFSFPRYFGIHNDQKGIRYL